MEKGTAKDGFVTELSPELHGGHSAPAGLRDQTGQLASSGSGSGGTGTHLQRGQPAPVDASSGRQRAEYLCGNFHMI